MNSRTTTTATVAFCCIFVLITLDLGWDYAKGVDWLHISAELAVMLIAAFSATLLFRRIWQERASMVQLQSDLAATREESQHWRQQSLDLVTGLGTAIRVQFGEWRLSEAEAEIGLLLLKGLSLKEVAGLRDTSERTVREQARSLYRKAGIGGRAALSAYFLEDLLLPQGGGDSTGSGMPTGHPQRS